MHLKQLAGAFRRRFGSSWWTMPGPRLAYRNYRRLALELLEDRTLLSAHLNQLFVERAYPDFLAKTPDSATEQSLISQLQRGTSRLAIAQNLEQTSDYWTGKIRQTFETVLRREPHDGGLQ